MQHVEFYEIWFYISIAIYKITIQMSDFVVKYFAAKK